MEQGLRKESGGGIVTAADFRGWGKENLPRGYENEWEEAILAIINSGNLREVNWEWLWSLRQDVLAIQQLLERVRFLIANWNTGELDGPKVDGWLSDEPVLRMQRFVLEGSVDLQGVYSAQLHDPEADISPYAHPEAVRFNLAPHKGRDEPGRPQDHRLMFRLLLTPYNRVIEEEMETAVQEIANSRLEETGERLTPRELERKRVTIRSPKRRSVQRAWSALHKGLEGPVFAFFLALQFCLTRYAEQKETSSL